jgi:hypothetical protein
MIKTSFQLFVQQLDSLRRLWTANILERTSQRPTVSQWVYFHLFYPCFWLILPKSFIPSINCSILRPRNGRRIGLTPLRQFSVHNMNSTTAGTQTQANVEMIWNPYVAIFSYALRVNKLHSRHQFERNQLRNQICSTLFSSLQSLSVRKLTNTSPLILRPLTMFSYGGGNDVQCIHACPRWLWITWAFLVCFFLTTCHTTCLILSQATLVDVERVFSCGRLILSHVRSRLSAQSTRALLCIRHWSEHNFIKDVDVEMVVKMPDVTGGVDYLWQR